MYFKKEKVSLALTQIKSEITRTAILTAGPGCQAGSFCVSRGRIAPLVSAGQDVPTQWFRDGVACEESCRSMPFQQAREIGPALREDNTLQHQLMSRVSSEYHSVRRRWDSRHHLTLRQRVLSQLQTCETRQVMCFQDPVVGQGSDRSGMVNLLET